jgi:hypothetical protein
VLRALPSRATSKKLRTERCFLTYFLLDKKTDALSHFLLSACYPGSPPGQGCISKMQPENTKGDHDMTKKLAIEYQTDTDVVLAVEHAGKHWAVHITVDFDNEDGGIFAQIGRDNILCTETSFGWHEKHDNEPQE